MKWIAPNRRRDWAPDPAANTATKRADPRSEDRPSFPCLGPGAISVIIRLALSGTVGARGGGSALSQGSFSQLHDVVQDLELDLSAAVDQVHCRPRGIGHGISYQELNRDTTDAVVLANILRTDRDAHRPLPADTKLAQAVRVLARAQQDAVWSRQQIGNQIRYLLKCINLGCA